MQLKKKIILAQRNVVEKKWHCYFKSVALTIPKRSDKTGKQTEQDVME